MSRVEWPSTPNGILDLTPEDLKEWSRDEVVFAYREDLAWAVGKIMGMQEAFEALKQMGLVVNKNEAKRE